MVHCIGLCFHDMIQLQNLAYRNISQGDLKLLRHLPVDNNVLSLSPSLPSPPCFSLPLALPFSAVRLHILSTPYSEISPAFFSFNHLTLHSFMQFTKASDVQVKGKEFWNKKWSNPCKPRLTSHPAQDMCLLYSQVIFHHQLKCQATHENEMIHAFRTIKLMLTYIQTAPMSRNSLLQQ